MEFEDVDYFPSYELIASPFAQASFYESNLRSVCKAGVDLVMKTFLQEHGTAVTVTERDGDKKPGPANFDPACEELLLEAYAE